MITFNSDTKVSINTPTKISAGDLSVDAWGSPYVSMPHSLFHGMFTFDIPSSMWITSENGTETTTPTTISSSLGLLTLTTTSVKHTLKVYSRRNPRYQPNRGHRYSTSMILPNKTLDGTRDFGLFNTENGVFFRLKSDGKLYAVLRNNSVETHEQEIDTSHLTGFDVQKGNIYDIQFQWRGVGSYKFYIGDPATSTLKLVHTIKLLGTLTTLSLVNPALPAAFLCVRGTQDVTMQCGCVDITSENGDTDREQYGSIVGTKTAVTNTPILAIRQPLTINSKINTRDIRLARILTNADKKVVVSMYVTRDPTAFTGSSFTTIGNGTFVEYDTSTTAVDTTKCKKITQFVSEANITFYIENPSRETIDFFLSAGDYLVLLGTGSSASVTSVIEFGEEI